jgi:hypothetical protein
MTARTVPEILAAAAAADLTPHDVSITWHDTTDEQAAAIVRLFSDRRWTAHRSGNAEWLQSRSGPFRDAIGLTVFLADRERHEPRPSRGEAVIAKAVQR